MATRPITIKRVMNTVSVMPFPFWIPQVGIRTWCDAPAPERQGESKVGHKKTTAPVMNQNIAPLDAGVFHDADTGCDHDGVPAD